MVAKELERFRWLSGLVEKYIVELRHRAAGLHSKARYIDFVDA